MLECILNAESTENLINAVSCVLEDIASKVVEVRMMLRNKCPWALYVSKATGRRWSTFIARRKFKGYHLKFYTDCAICTNLDTGKQHRVKLDSCTCRAFVSQQSEIKPCKHIQMVQRKIEQIGKVLLAEIDKLSVALAAVFTFTAVAVPAVEWENDPVCIDIAECPKGFWLEKTPNYQLAEYAVYCTERTNAGLKVRSIGKISETVDKDAISAMTPRDLKDRLFPSLMDAVIFLAKYSGVKGASQLALV